MAFTRVTDPRAADAPEVLESQRHGARIGVVNLGAATLKLALFETSPGGPREVSRREYPRPVAGASADWLGEAFADLGPPPAALGHRIVHGGRSLSQPVLITAEVESALEAAIPLAPLHNGPALEGIRAARRAWPGTPAVAVFDTSFHANRPRVSMRYALPDDIVEAHGIQRYGFHGLAHESLLEATADLKRMDATQVTAVTLQLGAGCSACAIQHGCSIETSMGYTPLEGLVMGTRSGSLDPAIPLQLMRAGLDADAIEELLTRRSGLYALAGTADMRVLCAAAARGEVRAQAALDHFAYGVALTVGAYFTLLGGAGALVFGGGIGTHAERVRAAVCGRLGAWDVRLDTQLNERNQPGRISAPGTRDVYICRTDEERIIVRRVLTCMGTSP